VLLVIVMFFVTVAVAVAVMVAVMVRLKHCTVEAALKLTGEHDSGC
jgi:hypothetical protein